MSSRRYSNFYLYYMTCCPMADTTHVLAHTVVQIKLKINE
nr:MAG TPA: hypothetical protein [Caudoviricetes sp.]